MSPRGSPPQAAFMGLAEGFPEVPQGLASRLLRVFREAQRLPETPNNTPRETFKRLLSP